MTAALATGTHCQSLTMAGEPCRSVAVMACDHGHHCNSHCPTFQAARQEARRRGGRNSSAVERAYTKLPSDLKSVAVILGETIVAVRDGQLSPSIGNSIASLSRSLVVTLESANLSSRMDGLEAVLGRLDEQLDLRVVA